MKIFNMLNIKNKFAFFSVFLTGVIAQVSLIFRSGMKVKDGYEFWGVQFHDGLWHLSIAQKLMHLSLENPVYGGEKIANYHYLSNLIIAFTSRLTGISIFDVFFRVYPLCISIITGILTFILVKRLFKSEPAAIWSMFFVYLGSTFAFVLPFFGLGYVLLETVFWVQQPISTFTNIPFSASIPISLGAIIFLDKFLKNKNPKNILMLILLFSLLPVTKSHSVVFILILGLIGIIRLFTKKTCDLLLISGTSLVLGYLLISPTFKFEKHLIFEPGWYLRTMIEAPDRMNWQDWALRLQFYKYYHDIDGLIRFYVTAFIIFFFGNLGTRVVAFISLLNIKKFMKNEVHQFLVLSALVFSCIPMFFLTTGIAWNSIQFWYYFLFITALYSGYGISLLIKKIPGKWLKYLTTVLIVFLTIPVDLKTLYFFHSQKPDAVIKGDELRALKYLSDNGSYKDIVITYPLEYSFIEVSAFTAKSTYLGDWLQAIVPGHDYDARLRLIKENMQNGEEFMKFLKASKIKWIYIKDDDYSFFENLRGVESSYVSDRIRIYHVKEI